MPEPVWSPEELTRALDLFLSGRGINHVAGELNRSPRAVEDFLYDDLPRNYRNVIRRLPREGRTDRDVLEWTRQERLYLQRLLRKGRELEEVCLILGRSLQQVRQEMDSVQPARRGAGLDIGREDKK